MDVVVVVFFIFLFWGPVGTLGTHEEGDRGKKIPHGKDRGRDRGSVGGEGVLLTPNLPR